MGVGDLSDGVNVGDVAVRIAQGLQVNGFGVGLDGGGNGVQVMDVHKGSLNTVLGQGVGQQVIAAAVDGLLGHDMLSRLSQGLDDVSDGRGAGGGGQRRHTPLQGGQPSLQYILSGVGQPTVDVAGVRQTEPGGGVGGVSEHIGGGLIDGHRPGVGGGVGLLLAHMELQGLKFITHGKIPLSLGRYHYIPINLLC